MNKELQEENYYMAEFEFKLLGIGYYLNHGKYYKALSMMNDLHSQLSTKTNLIKIPIFTSKKDELDFYLDLQNPRTGAFMDDNYPLNSYHGPTENVLLHLDSLAEASKQTLRLKYPLKYLENIDSIEEMTTVLNDWSTVNWIVSKLPQTPFHNARDILSLARDSAHYDANTTQMVIQKHHLYDFSPEWKKAMLQWFYEYQDPETGLWGPKFKNGKLAKKDLSNTASILKAFVDEHGNAIHKEFPLRYGNELFLTILETLDRPPPSDNQMEEWHEWGLKTPKGIRTLTRYLWKHASQENKAKAKILIEEYIKTLFVKLYIPKDGAFSYYPNSENATLDGTASGIYSLKEFGAFSKTKQSELWGTPEENINDLGIRLISEFSKNTLDLIENHENINSIRLYETCPDYANLTKNVSFVIYPKNIVVLDIMDSIPKMQHWLDMTSQTMGNWVSKEELSKTLKTVDIEAIPIYEALPVEEVNNLLQKNGKVTMIGFDVLQIPRYKITYELASEKKMEAIYGRYILKQIPMCKIQNFSEFPMKSEGPRIYWNKGRTRLEKLAPGRPQGRVKRGKACSE